MTRDGMRSGMSTRRDLDVSWKYRSPAAAHSPPDASLKIAEQ